MFQKQIATQQKGGGVSRVTCIRCCLFQSLLQSVILKHTAPRYIYSIHVDMDSVFNNLNSSFTVYIPSCIDNSTPSAVRLSLFPHMQVVAHPVVSVPTNWRPLLPLSTVWQSPSTQTPSSSVGNQPREGSRQSALLGGQ